MKQRIADFDPDGALAQPRERGAGDSERSREIFQVAARIFSERGFHATSINEIAEAVELTKAGLYYYIKGKSDLLFRIMDVAMVNIEEQVIRVAEREADPGRRLEVLVRRHAALVTQPGSAPFALLVDELGALEGESKQTISDRQKSYVSFIRSTLLELQSTGRLRQGVDPLAASFALLGMVLWTSRWYRPDGRLTSDAIASQLADLALNGVLQDSDPDDH